MNETLNQSVGTATHTPGPWKASSRALTDNSLVVVRQEWNAIDGCEEICCVRPREDRQYGGQDEKDLANANLIAAAPELLEALQELLICANGNRDAMHAHWTERCKAKARAAIAKATRQMEE